MMTKTTGPRIYVACLASYNSGTLYGAWIDATQDAEDILEDVKKMLSESSEPGAEEWAIHDYDGFEGATISEMEDFGTVSSIARGIEEFGEAFAIWYSDGGSTDYDKFQESYQGEFDSEEVFARQLCEDTWEIPDHLAPYIDWEAVARDLFINDYWSEYGHVFDRRI